ncbi:SGNH/GDSL hydrolase family protein [Leptospira semungkisensis]|uniref:SGNH/GDSL hydrolase family protein n=1 Tax=Leptospira semungkisensis TaxID=2484985 RepID=A0A4R9FS66_9LEPT|nr:SGNH/GDSL hydrolase family protein [Leptospira semungkisensis]TGK01676.1 SGNH/GDSL hydrolase family protein [Leptospira semungkisensis]
MNIDCINKKDLFSNQHSDSGLYLRATGKFIALFLVAFLSFCTSPGEKDSKNNKLYKPTFALFGDSISAFWPVEDQFSDFQTYKVAFPVRSTIEIQSAAINNTGHYRVCMLNGGVNDFLSNYEPTWEEVQTTVDRQVQTIGILRSHCDYIIALNTWNVKLPWPVEAASMINTEMKAKVNFVPRVDPEDLIHPEMLLDGGHLTPEGYGILSERVRNYLKLTLPEFWLEYM